MNRDPIARALVVTLARWDRTDLVGLEAKLVGARAPLVVTGYSPHGRNVHFQAGNAGPGWMNAREFVRRLG